MAKDAEYRVIKDNMKDIESNTKDIPALDNVNFGNLNCMEPKAFSDMEKSKKDEMKKDTYEMKINLKFLSPISDCTTPATVVETTAPTN